MQLNICVSLVRKMVVIERLLKAIHYIVLLMNSEDTSAVENN